MKIFLSFIILFVCGASSFSYASSYEDSSCLVYTYSYDSNNWTYRALLAKGYRPTTSFEYGQFIFEKVESFNGPSWFKLSWSTRDGQIIMAVSQPSFDLDKAMEEIPGCIIKRN